MVIMVSMSTLLSTELERTVFFDENTPNCVSLSVIAKNELFAKKSLYGKLLPEEEKLMLELNEAVPTIMISILNPETYQSMFNKVLDKLNDQVINGDDLYAVVIEDEVFFDYAVYYLIKVAGFTIDADKIDTDVIYLISPDGYSDVCEYHKGKLLKNCKDNIEYDSVDFDEKESGSIYNPDEVFYNNGNIDDILKEL